MKHDAWMVLVMASLALVLVACDDGQDNQPADTAVETEPDVADDTITQDVVEDSPEEHAMDVVEEPACLYPPEPYGFSMVGQTAPPMAWPSAYKGPMETSELAYPDLETFFCDPGVQSIIVVIATTWCPYCPDRVRNLAGLHDHYETYGARFVWVLGDGTSPSHAYSYFSGYGADFGWFTDDADNSMGAYTITGSSMLEGVPWVFVMDGESMEILYDNPTSVYTITKNLYED